MKVGIIGSGNVAITTAFAIAEKGSGHVVLWGRTEGQAEGKALDLAEASPIRRYDVRISGTDQFEALMNANVLILAAGKRRKAGMNRFDLFDDNLAVVHEMADKVKAGYQLDEPPLVLVMTGPIDLMTLAFQQRTGWPRERIMGVGGTLSASRLRHFIARELGISAADVDAMVVGTHDEEHMVILERYSRISGLPLGQFLSREKIDELFDKTRRAGTSIVEQAKLSSSFYTPGAAAGELVQAIAMDNDRVLLVSTVLEGEYGVKGRAVSVPAKIGCAGVKKIYELELDQTERAAFEASVAAQESLVAKVGA